MVEDNKSSVTDVFSFVQDTPEGLTKNLNAHIENYFFTQVRKYTVWIVASVFLVGFGGIIATLWDLNGQIYRAVGMVEAANIGPNTSSEIAKLKKELSSLTKETKQLRKMVGAIDKGAGHGN